MRKSILVKVWVAQKDLSCQLYSSEEQLQQLTEDHYQKFLPKILESICDYGKEHDGREPGEDIEDNRVFCQFRIALHYTEEINNMVLSPDFFQGNIGEGCDSDFTPIIHILQDADGLIFLQKNYTDRYKDAPRYRFIIDSSIWNYLAIDEEDFKEDVKKIISNWKEGYYYLNIAKEYADLNARLTRESYLGKKNGSSVNEGHGAEVSPFLFHSETLLRNKINTNEISNYKWRILLLDDKIDKDKEEQIYVEKNGQEVLCKKNTGQLSNDKNIDLTKAKILENRINEMAVGGCKCVLADDFKKHPEIEDYNIQIVCVETIKEALKLMRDYEFDIILLDYLLQFVDENHKRQADYGYKLLTRLKSEYEKVPVKKSLSKSIVEIKTHSDCKDVLLIEDFDIDDIMDDAFKDMPKEIKAIDLRGTNIRDLIVDRKKCPFDAIQDEIKIYLPARDFIVEGTKNVFVEKNLLKGPQEKFFFMFISAFTTAVNERLTLEGFSRDEEIWEIGEGACPTNTPELFKYCLAHLMKRRLDQTGISDLTEKNIIKTIKDIFSVQDKDNVETKIKEVRKQAYKNYHKVLGYHYDYSILRENDRGKSVLVDSFLEKQVHLGAMLEHLLQMVHLIAFGTVRQWPEIWEEYKFLTRTISDERNSLPEISKLIEDYIIALKAA